MEALKIYISLVLILKGLKLSDSDILTLAYFMQSGYNNATKDSLIEMKFVKNNSILRNTISRLRRQGFIVKDGYTDRLCKELNVELGDVNLLKIYLDNR